MDKNRRTHSKDDNQLREIEFGPHTLTTEDHQYEIHIPDKENFEKVLDREMERIINGEQNNVDR